MNYWLLTTEYPPFYGGGISTYCKQTASMLAEKGHQVTVFVSDITLQGIRESENGGIRLVRFGPSLTNANSFMGNDAALSYEFAEIVKRYLEKEGAPDILESQEYNGIAYYVQQFKLLAYPLFKELNILITCHAPSFICLEYNHVPVYKFPTYWIGQMEKASMKAADILISPSRYLVSEAKKRMNWEGISEHILPNPIVLKNTDQAVPDYQPYNIICFGKLAPLKGTFELLKYFDKLWQSGFNHSLRIVGGINYIFQPENREMGEILKKKYQHYIDKGLLVFCGEVSPEKAQELLHDAHVVLVPSLFDNLPYTVLEAMSLGKVVLASTNGGHSEVIRNGENGFLFNHKIQDDFAAKLQHILALPSDKILATGAQAKTDIVANFDTEVIYNRKMEVIGQYLKNKQPRTVFPFTEPAFQKNKEIAALGEFSEPVHGLLSVVVPFYNLGAYLDECLESVFSSDYKQLEVLVINDGSTDELSIRKLAEVEKKYPAVTVHHTPNQGLSATRNYGAKAARGQYLAFLDADDTVLPDYFTKAVQVFEKYSNVHFAGSWIKYFENSQDIWPTFNPEPPYLLVHNMVNSSSLVFKRDSFLKGGLNDPDLIYGMEDWDSVISMIGNGYQGVVLPELLFNYRVRKNSMARGFTKVKMQYLYRLIIEKHAALLQSYGADVVLLLNNNGSNLDFDNPTFEARGKSLFQLSGAFKEKLKLKVKSNKLLRKIAYSIMKQVNI